MSNIALSQTKRPENAAVRPAASAQPVLVNWPALYRLSAASILAQLGLTVIIILVSTVLGLDAKPTTALDYFEMYAGDLGAAFLRDDFSSLIIIGLYLGLVPGLFGALRRDNPGLAALASVMAVVGVACGFATHSGFSLYHLSGQYTAATTAAERAQIVAAGEAVLAANIWNSSGGYMAGIMLQGYGVILSLLMLRGSRFSKVTAIAGLLANGLDLAQHLIHPFAPALAASLLQIAGPFYLVWFPMLARDLLRLARRPVA